MNANINGKTPGCYAQRDRLRKKKQRERENKNSSKHQKWSTNSSFQLIKFKRIPANARAYKICTYTHENCETICKFWDQTNKQTHIHTCNAFSRDMKLSSVSFDFLHFDRIHPSFGSIINEFEPNWFFFYITQIERIDIVNVRCSICSMWRRKKINILLLDRFECVVCMQQPQKRWKIKFCISIALHCITLNVTIVLFVKYYIQFMADKCIIEIIRCWKHWSWLVYMVMLFAFSSTTVNVNKISNSGGGGISGSNDCCCRITIFTSIRIKCERKKKHYQHLFTHSSAHIHTRGRAHGLADTQPNTLHETLYIINK